MAALPRCPPPGAHPQPTLCAGPQVPYPGRASHPQAPSLGGPPRHPLCTGSQVSLPLDALSCMSSPGCLSWAIGSPPLGALPLGVLSSAPCPPLPGAYPSPESSPWEPILQAFSCPLLGALPLGDTPSPTPVPRSLRPNPLSPVENDVIEGASLDVEKVGVARTRRS